MAEALSDLGIQDPVPEQQWQDWASSLLYAPELVDIPTPYGFDRWQDWASRMLETAI